MSLVDETLTGLTENDITAYSTNPNVEPHIVVNSDRTITVPNELRKIAVQYDHNIETVTFDCPRYWDNHDLSRMVVYINYMLPNGDTESYPADDVVIDEVDSNIMHFNWTISKNVTKYKGNISFLICVKQNYSDGTEKRHWNSELCKDLIVSEGMECDNNAIIESEPDLVTQILTRLDYLEQNSGGGGTGLFVVNFTGHVDSNDTLRIDSCDRSVDDIVYNNPGIAYITVNNVVYTLIPKHFNNSDNLFVEYVSEANITDKRWIIYSMPNNVWGSDRVEDDEDVERLKSDVGILLNHVDDNDTRITSLESQIGDIDALLDDLHAYAQGIVSGGDA